MGDGLFVHGGVTSALEARLALAGLLALQGPTALDVRTGVLHGPGTTALVTGTSATAPMQVAIGVHDGVSSRGVANGPYVMPTEAVQLVNIGAAPASGTRIDIVYEKQGDATPGVPTPDGATAPVYGVKVGTVGAGKPPLDIVGAEELATVAVSAGATATNGANVVITNTARQTVARGADIPVRNEAERDELESVAFVGLAVKRLDDGGRVERWTGSAWAAESDVPVLASIAARNTYFTGNLRAGASALVAGSLHTYDGATWRFKLGGVLGDETDNNGLITFAHGGGQLPRYEHITPRGQTSDYLNTVVDIIAYDRNATDITVRVRQTDTNSYLLNTFVAFAWEATF